MKKIQQKIEVGDVVRRINSPHGKYDIGDTFVVCQVKYYNQLTGEVHDPDGLLHSTHNLELVSKKEVNNQEHSNKPEETKMNKPETQLEKTACKEAIQDSIKKEIEKKKLVYLESMASFMRYERDARYNRKRADEMKKNLNISEAQMKELF